MRLKDGGVRFPNKTQGKVIIEEEKKGPIKKKLSITDEIDETLKLVSENYDRELLMDLIESLKSQKKKIESSLQLSMNNNSPDEIEYFLEILDKIQGGIANAQEKTQKNSGERISASNPLQFKSHNSEKSPSGPEFDIFDLDLLSSGNFEAVNLPVQASPSLPQNKYSNFSTDQPIKFNYPELEKIEKEDPKIAALRLENSQLKEALEFAKSQIYERDIALKNLTKTNAELIQEKDELLISLTESKRKLEYLETENKKNEEIRKNIKLEFSSKNPVVQQEIPKQAEKKSTLDFDLDFILSPQTDKKPASNKKLPNLFDDSSSEEQIIEPVPQQIEIKPENDLTFRMGNCMEMGVLIDNEFIQVAFQVKRQGNELMSAIFIGNKSAEPITEIVTELTNLSMEVFPVMIQPIKTTEELLENCQTTRMVKAQLCDFTSKVPKLSLSIKSKSQQSYSLKLPLTLTRFIEGRQELPSSIWIEWKKLVFEEDTSVVNLAVFSSLVEMCSFLCLGGAFRIYSGSELEELGSTKVLAAGQLGDILIMFCVSVVSAVQGNISIRCRNAKLRAAIFELVLMQISRI